MHRTEATVGEEVTMQPRNTVVDFNKLAAEAKGSTLLRIMHDKSAVRAPVVGTMTFASRQLCFYVKEKLP
jgi:hypothetical protein